MLSSWTVSQRLFAVIALALLIGLVFGGLRVAGAEGSATQFGQVAQLANLGEQDTVLIQDLQNERDATAGLQAGGPATSLGPLFAATDVAAARVRQAVAGIGTAFPANIRSEAATVLADISPSRITALHDTLQSGEDTPAEITAYGTPISDMIALNDQIAQGVPDSALVNDVRTLNVLSLAKEEASQQRALLYSLFSDPYFVDGDPSPVDAAEVVELNLVTSQEVIDEAAYQTTATPAERTLFANALNTPKIGSAAEIEDFVFGNAPTQPATAPLVPNPLAPITALGFSLQQAPQRWYSVMSAKVDAMRGIEKTIAANIVSRAQALQSGAQWSAVVNALITAAALLVVLGAALLVARSLVLPLRRLQASALDIATAQLPERVKRLSESPDAAPNLEVAPIDVLTADEIGQVARAFDQVHAEAVRLAGNEAIMRTTFNAVFVNLSRRSQSLIERLARMIDSLERDENDAGRLSSLFSMDHLITRMRRNSENLLLLAGHEGARKWSEPVAVSDVALAATAEIEQYSRVVLDIQPGVAVAGQAVSDVVHLLAELIENATLFSPKDTKVQVTAQELNSGGVLIDISDKGIGISETRLAEMNWRLDNSPVMDVSVSRHMGLFAVARLAERNGIRVRLRPATRQGLSVLVWLPDSIVERVPRGYAAPSGWWSKPFSTQASLLPGRSGVQQVIGSRSAAEGSAADDDDQMSAWFRNRRIFATGVGSGNASRPDVGVGGWQSGSPQPAWSGPLASDPWAQGRHAAEIIADPIRGDLTAAGLPLRVPKANLLPGSAGPIGPGRPGGSQDDLAGFAPAPAPPRRSAEMARSRLSGFQSGARRAQDRGPGAGEPTGFGRQERGSDS